MLNRKLSLLLFILLAPGFAGCALSRDFTRNLDRDPGYGGYHSAVPGELPTNCRLEKEARQWYFLYGSYNLFGDEIVNTLKRKDRVFRLRPYTTFWDKFISIGLGFVSSITVQTVEIKSCESRAGGMNKREAGLREKAAEIAKQKEALEERARLLEEKEKAILEREKQLKERGGTDTPTTPN